MVKTCCVWNCRNKSKKIGTSFFCFPKVPQLRREWIRRINRPNFHPTRHTVLCSDHFDNDSFLSESVPEFLKLIGLKQRPIRRRLRPGAVPTLFKFSHGIWEEGEEEEDVDFGSLRRHQTDCTKDEKDDDDDEEEIGSEDTVVDDRFAAQMNVAEEDGDLPEHSQDKATTSLLPTTLYDPATQDPPSVPPRSYSDRPTKVFEPDADPTKSASDNDGASVHDKEDSEAGGGSSEDSSSSDADEPVTSVKEEPRLESVPISTSAEKSEVLVNRKNDKEATPKKVGSGLCKMESKGPSDDMEGIEDTAINKVKPSTEGPESAESSPTDEYPPLKKHKASKWKSSPKSLSKDPPLVLPVNPSSTSIGPVLYRIDPAFCKFQPFFEVPSSSFSAPKAEKRMEGKQEGSLLTGGKAANNHANTSHDASSKLKGETASQPAHEPAAAPADHCLNACLSDEDQICTMACCIGKLDPMASPTKHDGEETLPPSHDPDDTLPTLPIIPKVTPKSAPPEIPYRSDPIPMKGITFTPFRSEPLRKLPTQTALNSSLRMDAPEGGMKRHSLLIQNVEQPRSQSLASMLQHQGSGDAGGQLEASRMLSSRHVFQGKSVSTSTVLPRRLVPKVDSGKGQIRSGLKNFSLVVPSIPDSSGQIFIRRQDILADLLDVFKRSANTIHRGTTFTLCNKTTAPESSKDLHSNLEEIPCRRLFTLFWKECLRVHFDGDQQKVPKVDSRSGTSSDVPYILGKILRHGLVLCGYWPVAFSTACAVSVFTGEKCSRELFLTSLRRAMFPYETLAMDDLRESARGDGVRFQAMRKEGRMAAVVKAYGGAHCQVPSRGEEVEGFVLELAAYYLYCQPFWWLREMRRGLLSITEHTRNDQAYLTSLTEAEVVEMYHSLEPTPHTLLKRITLHLQDTKLVSLPRLKGFLERALLRLSRVMLIRLVERWSHSDCLLYDTYHLAFVSPTSGVKSPPFFYPSHNTLVLSQNSPSFRTFLIAFNTLLEDSAAGV